MILVYALCLYALVGAIVAPAFFWAGVRRVLPGATLTPGAQLLLLPGALVLWPLLLRRWIDAGSRR